MHGETYVVRRSGKSMTIFGIVGLIALIDLIVDFEETMKKIKGGNIVFGAFVLFLLLMTFYSFFMVVDKRERFSINAHGVAIRGKGFISWSELDSFHLDIKTGRNLEAFLYFNLKVGDNIKVDITHVDKEPEGITSAIRRHSMTRGIRDSGLLFH